MHKLPLALGPHPRILCLGAHSDDIEIGCGGTMLRLMQEYPGACVDWVVFACNGTRSSEARASANDFLQAAKEKKVVTKDFRDGFLPYTGGEVKDFFETLKDFNPDLIFTHCRHDLHQDHRLLCELTWNTFRDHLVLEYEIPKYDGDLGQPNFFIELDEATCRRKSEYLVRHFQTQHNRHWFSDETFRAILRIRGVECRATTSYAEAFYCRKLVLRGC
jgi:LmbE family N-acetylglucosaminyl deacetylase